MRSLRMTKTRFALGLAMLVAGLTLTGGAASAASVTIELCAKPGTVSLPGAANVPIWGFGVPSTPGDCSTAVAGLPGPNLAVDQGDTVTLQVTNQLPTGHTVSMEIPGVRFDPGPVDAASGSSVSVSFTAADPGTYLYQSGGDAGRQEAMGLSGALVVRSATAGQAYGSAASAYDVQQVLVLSALDPAFNAAPDTYDMLGYTATYWLINGQSYPDVPAITASAGQRVLLRYLNAGYDNTTMQLLGTHETVVARSAHPLSAPNDVVAETIPAGASADTIVTMPGFAPPTANGFPLFNRQLHVTNGDQTGNDPLPSSGGGMLTFLTP